MTTREEVTLLFEERRDAWLRGDLDAYLALWAEDMTYQSPLHVEPLRGRAAFARLVRQAFVLSRPLAFDFTHIAVVGDVVLAERRRGAGRPHPALARVLEPGRRGVSFAALFGRSPPVTADAPGRVNLIGEHTDYNQGFVLPMPIPQRTVAELAPRADEQVRAASASLTGEVEQYALGAETPGRGWLDYVQGLTWALRADGALILGFDLRVASSVPIGAGLASSGALEVAVLRALRAAFRLPLDDVELALLGQRAENEFVGARVGVMDQMAASLGVGGRALLIDTRSLEHRSVALPAGAELVVIDSGVAHRNRAGGYNARRAECERACALLGVRALRDLAAADLPSPRWRRATSSAWAPCWTPPTPRCATTTRSRRPRSISWSRSPARSRRRSAHA